MTIDFTLDEKSLDRAIKLVGIYQEDLLRNTRNIVDRLGQVAENNARLELQDHIWSGETLASLHTEKNDTKYTTTRTVKAGGAAIWLEFGTGVVANNCTSGDYVHPYAKELGMDAIGEYGHGWGSNPNGWYFYDDGQYDAEWVGGTYNTYNTGPSIHTFGIKSTLFMYHSAWAARRELPKYAKGVFKT